MATGSNIAVGISGDGHVVMQPLRDDGTVEMTIYLDAAGVERLVAALRRSAELLGGAGHGTPYVVGSGSS